MLVDELERFYEVSGGDQTESIRI